MESLNPKRSLIEEDENISIFRRRNKIIILVLLFLIISSALIIAALIVEILRIHNTSSSLTGVQKSPIRSFCSVSDSPTACLYTFYAITNTNSRVIVDPDQFLTISLQTSVFEIQSILNSSSIVSDSNCSHSLSHALGQLGRPLAEMRVNPFVSTLSDDQRGMIGKRIIAAGEDVRSCIDDLEKVGQLAPEKLGEVEVYLNAGRDFLFRYGLVLRNWSTSFVMGETSLIYDHLFEIVMCGLQVMFMFGMFFALFRIH